MTSVTTLTRLDPAAAKHHLLRAARGWHSGNMTATTAAVIVAEWTHDRLDDTQTWDLFCGLVDALLLGDKQLAGDLIHHLIHGRPLLISDTEMLAIADAVGVTRRPLSALTPEYPR